MRTVIIVEALIGIGLDIYLTNSVKSELFIY